MGILDFFDPAEFAFPDEKRLTCSGALELHQLHTNFVPFEGLSVLPQVQSRDCTELK